MYAYQFGGAIYLHFIVSAELIYCHLHIIRSCYEELHALKDVFAHLWSQKMIVVFHQFLLIGLLE